MNAKDALEMMKADRDTISGRMGYRWDDKREVVTVGPVGTNTIVNQFDPETFLEFFATTNFKAAR